MFLEKYAKNSLSRRLFYVLVLSIPVILYVFKFSVLYRYGIFRGEDWDYFAQSYEAARQSILHYNQFPWWNPWMNGGQPLFANPQFGLFSIQMPLVLLFGTVAGLHLSILAYFLLGFWGMYLLLQRVGSSGRSISVLLSYVWTFSGFTAWHISGGHLTFAIYLLTPWLFLTLLNIHKGKGWVWFGLWASLLINTAAHYLTFEALIVAVFIATLQIMNIARVRHLGRSWREFAPVLLPYIYASALILVLSGARLFYTFQLLHDYPRPQELDPPNAFKLFLASLVFRTAVEPSYLTQFGVSSYGWVEYSGYFGLTALALFIFLLIRRFEKIMSISRREWLLIGGIFLAALISLGAFSKFSPYSILHSLPVFGQMRVPSRFICWVVFGVILFLAKVPKKPVVYVLLVIAIVDLFFAHYKVLNYPQRRYNQEINLSRPFQQYEFYKTNPQLGHLGILNIQDLRLLRATQTNSGEIYGYEPLLNIGEYYYLPGTTRCGVNRGCPFILSSNARVISWSPHKISLMRTGPGPIQINMNPGKVWLVNGKSVFSNYRVLELQKDFIITDKSNNISVEFSAAN